MAAPGDAAQKLDRIVRLIARGMVAEVCSVYVMRPGDLLVLWATEGLRKDAVHRTRLRVGEGLVGDIAAYARPLALGDAQAHPQFAYRPETGEEIYHSLLGVPILRDGRVLGVLVIQHQTKREYTEEEVETLETVAMVVAELLSTERLGGVQEARPAEGTGPLPLRLEGVPLNGGLALGVAVLHRRGATVGQMVAEDPEAELDRLASALEQMHSALDAMLDAQRRAGLPASEPLDILRVYRMIAADQGWLGRIREAIRGGLTAEAAVSKVLNDTRARMQMAADPYLRERLMDLDDLGYRLLQHLAGELGVPREMPENAVLIARSMGPAELLDYDRSRLVALVLEQGSYNAHVAIVARALDIPAVGGVPYVLSRIDPGESVLVDGDTGRLVVRPGEQFRQRFAESMALRARRRAEYAATRDLPAVTRDGTRVRLLINAGLMIDMFHLEDSGADGVGLFRTEVPFMLRAEFPDVDEQIAVYRDVFTAAAGRPVIFRTLDIGGDKLLPSFRGTGDENPALGWRALRIALDRPALLRQQLRALIRAAAGRELDVMFPMVAEVGEYDAARRLLDRELDRAVGRGAAAPTAVRVGAMLEVPALYFELDALLKRVDFLSVGSNDLVQFLFASDRGNPRVAGRYDPLSPAVLRLLRGVVEACAAAEVPLHLCGEMAGRPLEAMALVGIGFRSLSVPVASVGPVRSMVRSLDLVALRSYLGPLVDSAEDSLRRRLRDFALDHSISV